MPAQPSFTWMPFPAVARAQREDPAKMEATMRGPGYRGVTSQGPVRRFAEAAAGEMNADRAPSSQIASPAALEVWPGRTRVTRSAANGHNLG